MSAERPGEQPPAMVVQQGDGPPVLCLHGWGASSDLFAPLLRELTPSFSLVVPDLPGFGKTALPPQPWSIDDYVMWTKTLLERLGLGRVDIVAHSFGARIAIKLASAYPQMVSHLVLTGAAGLRPRRGLGYHVRVRTFKMARALAQTPFVPRSLRRMAQARVERSGSRDYRAAAGVMRQTFVRVVNEDLRGVLAHVAAPTLLVWGDADDETPLRDAREMERAIPDSGLVVFEGRGHYAYIEESARFAHIVATFVSDTR